MTVPSLRIRRMRAAEDPKVRAELATALAARWAARGAPAGTTPEAEALVLAGMVAGQASEAELAAYVASLERAQGPATADDAFAAAVVRIALRLDDPAVRSLTT